MKRKHSKYNSIIKNLVYTNTNRICNEFNNKLDLLYNESIHNSPSGYHELFYSKSSKYLLEFIKTFNLDLMQLIEKELKRLNTNLKEDEWLQIEEEIKGLGLSIIKSFEEKFKKQYGDTSDYQLLINTCTNNINTAISDSFKILKAHIKELNNIPELKTARRANKIAIIALVFSFVSIIISIVTIVLKK